MDFATSNNWQEKIELAIVREKQERDCNDNCKRQLKSWAIKKWQMKMKLLVYLQLEVSQSNTDQ